MNIYDQANCFTKKTLESANYVRLQSFSAHLGPIWYHKEPSNVPYSPNQFLGWDFFCRFLQQGSSSKVLETLEV